jgi:hypothetical protein
MARVSASQIKANPAQYAGAINVEKCIAYLRGIGVEVDDPTADGWLDTQSVHRFLRRMKRPALRVERWTCKCGEMEGFLLAGEKAPRPRKSAKPQKRAACEECGGVWSHMALWYVVTRDGTEKDYRPELERFSPFDWRELLTEHRGPHAQ